MNSSMIAYKTKTSKFANIRKQIREFDHSGAAAELKFVKYLI